MLAGAARLVYRRLLRPGAALMLAAGGGYLLFYLATLLKAVTTADGRRTGMMNALTD